jgi:hypothetical protein
VIETSQHSFTDDSTAPATADVKVLFLAGKGRSGGTLLANLLGQVPGFFNVGELNRLWDSGLVRNYSCGCGLAVRDCPTWNAILDAADAILGESPLVPLAGARIDLDQASVVRWPNIARLLFARPGLAQRWTALGRYTTASSAVYRAITVVTGARVVVDSSRLPIEPIGLGMVPGTDVRIGHVVRDPRAVTYSWKRRKAFTDREDGEQLPRFGPAFSTVSWVARNLVVEVLRRRRPSLIVSYDMLAREPVTVLRHLAALVDEPAGDLAFLTSEAATLVPTHSVGGNPVRMVSGAVSIEPDDEWRHAISARDRSVATLLALPLLHHYGFPVRTAPTGRDGERPARS